MIHRDQPIIFPESLISAVSSVNDGSMKFEWGGVEEVVHDSSEFLQRNDISIDSTVNMFISGQSGWDRIREVGLDEQGEGMRDPGDRVEADVLVTTSPETALFLPTADCYPVIMYDPSNRVLALLHLGWQSSSKDMATKTITYLAEHHNVNPSDLLVYIGPGIKQRSYRFEDPTQRQNPAWSSYLLQKDDNLWGIDLLGYNYDQILASGVLMDNVEVCHVDTAQSPDYYSHYGANNMGKTGPQGRFATVAMMR